MDIVSFQSRVVWGYVGNSIAVPVFQHFGLNAWPIDTVLLSHHPGHGPATRYTPSAKEITALSEQVIEKAQKPIAVIIGYLGNADQGAAIKQVIDRYRQKGHDLTIYLDPVFGDAKEGLYVDKSIMTFFKDVALPMSNIIMPNCFELEQLSGQTIQNEVDAVYAARKIIALGPHIVLVSSIPSGNHSIQNILATRDRAWAIKTPLLPFKAKGTGDMFSAAFTALHASGTPVADAFRIAFSIVRHAVINASERGLIELDLPPILAQNSQKIDDIRIDELST